MIARSGKSLQMSARSLHTCALSFGGGAACTMRAVRWIIAASTQTGAIASSSKRSHCAGCALLVLHDVRHCTVRCSCSDTRVDGRLQEHRHGEALPEIVMARSPAR